MKDFGYDVSNYTEVDPLFGNMNDFDNLMKEAKSKGNENTILKV
jgi:alpha-glucosidase